MEAPIRFRANSKASLAALPAVLSFLLVLLCGSLQAAPGDVLLREDFAGSWPLSGWSETGPGDVGIGSQTAQSGSQSLFLRWDTAYAETPAVNAAVPAASLSLWVQKGDDAFSEDPEASDENLLLQYLDSGGSWVTLETFSTAAPPGQVFTPSFDLPPNALHANLQLRFVLENGDGSDFDYWHVDDVLLTEEAATAALSLPFSDDFEDGSLDDWMAFGEGDAGIGTHTAQSGSHSMYLRWDTHTVLSPLLDASVPAADLSVWVRKGDDAFSEDPEAADENLLLQYQGSGGSWFTLDTFSSSAPDGEIFTPSYSLPAAALHSTLRFRFVLENGDGPGWDYWHVDDFQVAEPLSSNLLTHYAMEESGWSGASGEVADGSGNNHSGTAQGDATTAGTNPAISGSPGTCRYGTFDGSGDFIRDADAENYLNGLSAITVAAWVKSANDDYDGGIFSSIPKGGQDEDLGLRYDSSGLYGGGSRGLKASIRTTAGYTQIETESSLQTTDWQHVALVWESGSSLEVYVNGSRVSKLYDEGPLGGTLNAAQLLDIGHGTKGDDWNGFIDELRVYGAALSQGQVQRVYAETHPCLTGSFAYYSLDELSYDGTPGEVQDDSGNGNDGQTVGDVDATTIAEGKVCSAAAIAQNSGVWQNDAVDTGVDVDTELGSRGSVNFWYYANTRWAQPNEDRMLFDASTPANGRKYFYLALYDGQPGGGPPGSGNRGGRLQFGLEDDADNDFTLDTARYDFARDTWHHIGVTWDLAAGRMEIYVDGSLAADQSVASTGSMGDVDTLYFGDNRSWYTTNAMSGSSADGRIDEIRMYNRVISQGAMQADMAATHPCGGSPVDHYEIDHDGTAVTCIAENITVTAEDAAGNPVNPSAGTILDLSTSTGRGTWSSLVSGSGTLADPTPQDGSGSYTFSGGESSVVLALDYTNPQSDPESVDIGVSDGSATEDSGSATAADDPLLQVSLAGFVFTNDTDGNLIVPGQIAGKDSDEPPQARSLGLQAVRASDNDPSVCVPAFPPDTDVNVQLGAECRDPDTQAGRQVTIENNGNRQAIATSDDNGAALTGSFSPVSLRFDPDGSGDAKAPIVISYPDAGEMQLHVRHEIIDANGTATGDFMIGSSNRFVVRPFGFHVEVPGNPGATDAAGAVFTPSGSPFNATLRAVTWQGSDDADADGQPDSNAALADNAATPNFGQEAVPESAEVVRALVAPLAGSPGIFSGGTFSAFTGGSQTKSSLTWDEVGIISLNATLNDSDYLGSGQDVLGSVPYVGRFIPAWFAVSANNPVFAHGCTGFTYLGQEFGFAVSPRWTITAKNESNATTDNYAGSFWKLAEDLSGRSYANNATANATLAVSTNGTALLTGNGTYDGTGTIALINEGLTYAKPGQPAPPFEARAHLDLSPVDLTDADGVCFDPDGDGVCDGHRIASMNGTEQRFGRMTVDNAHGSELLPLGGISLQAEYFDGSGFRVSSNDTCSVYNASSIDWSGAVFRGDLSFGDLAASGNGTVFGGRGTFSIHESGNPGNGPGQTGTVDYLFPVQPWLEYDWNSTVFGPHSDPAARATFGIYRGQDGVIYRQETTWK